MFVAAMMVVCLLLLYWLMRDYASNTTQLRTSSSPPTLPSRLPQIDTDRQSNQYTSLLHQNVPDVPGLYESLLAKGLTPLKAADEYCAFVKAPYTCQSDVLRTKQFSEYTITYGLDPTTVYLGFKNGGDVLYRPERSVDRASFSPLVNAFFKDKNHVYFFDNDAIDEKPALKIISNVDLKTIKTLRNVGYFIFFDANHVYHSRFTPDTYDAKYVDLQIIPNADPQTITTSSKPEHDFEDKNNYYTYPLVGGFVVTPKNN
jgi:hypothetical protein